MTKFISADADSFSLTKEIIFVNQDKLRLQKLEVTKFISADEDILLS